MKGITRGEIYYANLNPVQGNEQGGYRPVIILQNNVGNQHSPTVIVAAISSNLSKPKLPTHVYIEMDTLPKPSIVLLEQIRTIDKYRLSEYLGRLNKKMMGKVDRAIVTSLGIKYLEKLL